MLFSDFVLTWPIEWVWGTVVPSLIGLTLLLLPRVKGAFVGVQWAVGDRARSE